MKKSSKKQDIEIMLSTLKKYYSNDIQYSCIHCLKEAYLSIIYDKTGYITDEELIKSSNYKLKHK